MNSVPKSLRVLFLSNAHNGLSQRARSVLQAAGHKVDVELAISSDQMIRATETLKPDLVLCPMLTSRVPEEIWQKSDVPCVIVHPGVQGDRGMSSIDWALRDRKPLGVTCLSAVEEMDAGPVWATRVVDTQGRDDESTITKSSVYKNEITDAAIDAIQETVLKVQRGVKPIQVREDDPATLGTLLPSMSKAERAVHFDQSADEVARTVRYSDGQPGATAMIADKEYFIFDARVEAAGLPQNMQDAIPGTILGKRNGAVLVACGGNTAVWIGQLRVGKKGIKNPAAMVLDSRFIGSLPYLPGPGPFYEGQSINAKWWKQSVQTWQDVWAHTVNRVCYVNFEFYNGAMGVSQSERLRAVLEHVRNMPDVDAIVLTGGYNTFSNGIGLCEIASHTDPAAESYRSINAINDVVKEVFSATEKITISALRGGAGAGGAMMALSSDRVWAHEGVVLNPHYKTMGLHGSEYWTHFLPARVGSDLARKITSDCHALSARDAVGLGIVDEILGSNVEQFQNVLHSRVKDLVESSEGRSIISEKKKDVAAGLHGHLEKVRSKELAIMRQNFTSDEYKKACERFVRKTKALVTPPHLTSRRGQLMDGRKHSKKTLKKLKGVIEEYRQNSGFRSPKLAILLVGGRADSKMYVDAKIRAAASIGVDVDFRNIAESEYAREEAMRTVAQWNEDDDIDGIMVQVPTVGVHTADVVACIDSKKDIDCLTPANFHQVACADRVSYLVPPCPAGIMDLLIDHGVQLKGKHAAVVGSSENLGLPVAILLEREGAQVTTLNVNVGAEKMGELLRNADIIVSATGVRGLIQKDMVKEGVVIVDAGISFDDDGKVIGDVAKDCRELASLVTPVPGGVGPVTIATLLRNVVASYIHRTSNKHRVWQEERTMITA